MAPRKSNNPVNYDGRTDLNKLEDTLTALTRLITSREGDVLTEDGYVATVNISCLLEAQEQLEILLGREVEEFAHTPTRMRWLVQNLKINNIYGRD